MQLALEGVFTLNPRRRIGLMSAMHQELAEVLQTLPCVKEIYSSFSYKSVRPLRVIPLPG